MKRQLRIYGVPMDLGQTRRGVDMGCSAIRYAGLKPRLEALGWAVCDSGNLPVPVAETVAPCDDPPEGTAHNWRSIRDVCQDIYTHMRGCIDADETAIFLGGDHSISLGTVAGALERSGRTGVLWVDAHGDFNTPIISPSGNVHGMVISALMGQWSLTIGTKRLEPSQIVYIATRDLDPQEKIAMQQAGVTVFTMRSIDENGMATVVHAALNALGNVDALHVSLDMDSLDPSIAPGVGTAVAGGLSYREAHLLMEMLADDGRVRSLDLVEVNPILDVANRTAEAAVGLAASLFGQRII